MIDDAVPEEADYEALADLHVKLRQLAASGDAAAREIGLAPQQCRFLVALTALPESRCGTLAELAHQMALRHHSVVELVDRLVARGLVRRERRGADRREVQVQPTAAAERMLRHLTVTLWRQLQSSAPSLIEALDHAAGRQSPARDAGRAGTDMPPADRNPSAAEDDIFVAGEESSMTTSRVTGSRSDAIASESDRSSDPR